MPPVDIDATVIANARLSRDYSVLSLAAPEVGRRTAPGQFVMVKPAGVTDPLLRRPFSVFEVLRSADGEVTGVSILNKRAGRSTNRLYELEPGDVVSCLGPLGLPFKPVAAPAEAWMVAGGVGLAPFATLAESLAASKTPSTLFYGARTAAELFYLEFFERLGIKLVLTTEDGGQLSKQTLREGPRHRSSRSGVEECLIKTRRPEPWSTPAGRSRCSKRSRSWRLATISRARCRLSASWAADSAVVTAASCRSSAGMTCPPKRTRE